MFKTLLIADMIIRELTQTAVARNVNARVADVQAIELVTFDHRDRDGRDHFRRAVARERVLIERAIDELGELRQRLLRTPRFRTRLVVADERFHNPRRGELAFA